MQVCSVNFRRYINSVIATIALEVRIGEGIADLEAVFPFTTVERRLDSRTRKADRIVVLVAIQGNWSTKIELEASNPDHLQEWNQHRHQEPWS